MTELVLTRHSLEKLKLLELSTEDAYGLFINAKKCSISERGWKRKQAINHHQSGSQLYRNDNYIMVVTKNETKFVLITIYQVDELEVLNSYKIKD